MLINVIVGVAVCASLLTLTRPGRRMLKAVGLNLSATSDRIAESIGNNDPLGVYKSQISNAVESGRTAAKVVEMAAKQLISLENQIAEGLKDQQRLTNRIRAVMKNGDPNKTATKYAAELARVEANLKVNEEQKGIAQAQYDENLALIERYENQISDARKDAEQLGMQLAQSETEKVLIQTSTAIKDQLNLGDLAVARRKVQDQINSNRGAAKAARDMSASSAAEEEDEKFEKSMAVSDILNRFKE
jgi:hypothetical protein